MALEAIHRPSEWKYICQNIVEKREKSIFLIIKHLIYINKIKVLYVQWFIFHALKIQNYLRKKNMPVYGFVCYKKTTLYAYKPRQDPPLSLKLYCNFF